MAIIYCFTSTGNSLYVARQIAGAVGGSVLPVRNEAVETDDDVVGFVFPVFFWGAPNIVNHFTQNIKITNPGAYVFAVATYGGAAPGAVGEVRKHLQDVELSYAAMLKSVENYVPMYMVNDNEEVHKKSESKLQEIIQDIAERKKNHAGRFWFIHQLFKKAFPGKKPDCDMKFIVSDGCTGCKICEKICPAGNITIADGMPVFAHRCEHCIACIHCCPAGVINYGKSQGKERYIHPEIGLNGLIEFLGK